MHYSSGQAELNTPCHCSFLSFLYLYLPHPTNATTVVCFVIFFFWFVVLFFRLDGTCEHLRVSVPVSVHNTHTLKKRHCNDDLRDWILLWLQFSEIRNL